METLRLLILVGSCGLILYGYFRFISDENGNVDLNSYRFTGGLGRVIGGMVEGTRDICSLEMTSNSYSALAIYSGALLFYICFKI